MKNSHRKVTFEMLENHEMFEMRGLYNEIDIWWYQSGAEKINKTIKNIISLILYYIFIKNGQMNKNDQQMPKIL